MHPTSLKQPWSILYISAVLCRLVNINYLKLLPYLHFLSFNGTPLQYSCLENPMDGGAWEAAVYGVAEGRTWLSDFTFTFHFHALEKEIATHSSVLAWRIPGRGEPGGLPSHRVGHDWSNLAAAAAAAGGPLFSFLYLIFAWHCP